jgi:hypothetical protein
MQSVEVYTKMTVPEKKHRHGELSGERELSHVTLMAIFDSNEVNDQKRRKKK